MDLDPKRSSSSTRSPKPLNRNPNTLRVLARNTFFDVVEEGSETREGPATCPPSSDGSWASISVALKVNIGLAIKVVKWGSMPRRVTSRMLKGGLTHERLGPRNP